MAKGINRVILIGNLGKDPELTHTQSNLAIAKFSLATTEGKKNSSGAWEDVTEWHNIVLFGKTAETAGANLHKGSQVYIEGRIQCDSWEEAGVKKYMTKIIGQKMLMVGDKRIESSPQRAPASPDTENDLPF
jgi:single-strand DNA-binding protein